MKFANKRVIVSGLLFSISFFSCQKNEVNSLTPTATADTNTSTTTSKTYPDVDQALWTYFEAFEEAAASRGKQIDLSALGVIGQIEEIEQDHVAGQCTWNSAAPEIVTIDLEFWNSSSNSWKEFVVFHELGHCVLNRDHREDHYSDGTCVSLMRSGLGGCIDNYNSDTRNIYLNELFSPSSIAWVSTIINRWIS